jgi:hypothetical protein
MHLVSLQIDGMARWDGAEISLATVTAVLGPNGSGKSIFAAAIRLLALGQFADDLRPAAPLRLATSDDLRIRGTWGDGSWAERTWTRTRSGATRGASCSWATGGVQAVSQAIRARLTGRPETARDDTWYDAWGASAALGGDGAALRRPLLAALGEASGARTGDLLAELRATHPGIALPREVTPSGDLETEVALEWLRGAEGRLRTLRSTQTEPERGDEPARGLALATRLRELEAARSALAAHDADVRLSARAAAAESRAAAILARLGELPTVTVEMADAALAAARESTRTRQAALAARQHRAEARRWLETGQVPQRPEGPSPDDCVERLGVTQDALADLRTQLATARAASQVLGVCPSCGHDLGDDSRAAAARADELSGLVATLERQEAGERRALSDVAAWERANDAHQRDRVRMLADVVGADPEVPEAVDIAALEADRRAALERAKLAAELAGIQAVEPRAVDPAARPVLAARVTELEALAEREREDQTEHRLWSEAGERAAEIRAQRQRTSQWLAWVEATQGRLLGAVRDLIDRPATDLAGVPIALDLADGGCVLRVRGVPVADCSAGERAYAIAAVSLALVPTGLSEWRYAALDGIESCDSVWRPRLAAMAVRASAQHGAQVVIAGCPDTWAPVDGVDVIDLGGES